LEARYEASMMQTYQNCLLALLIVLIEHVYDLRVLNESWHDRAFLQCLPIRPEAVLVFILKILQIIHRFFVDFRFGFNVDGPTQKL